MKIKNFKKAAHLATTFQFDDFGIHKNIKSEPKILSEGIVIGGHYENWIGLFFDDENGYFSIQLHEDGWKMCYDDVPFCKISETLSKKLDEFRTWELGKEEREAQAHFEWENEREELWRNYGPGKI